MGTGRHVSSVINGQAGGRYVATTAAQAVAGKSFGAFYMKADTKFHTLEGEAPEGIANTTEGSAITMKEGEWLFGDVIKFQLHSGAVIAYFLR